MHTSTILLLSMFACGQKESDTSSTDASETQESQDTDETQEAQDTGETQDDETQEPQDTDDAPESEDTDGADEEEEGTGPENAGEEGVNTSEAPPTGSCLENTASIQTEDTTYNFSTFYWDFDETEGETKILVTGHQVGLDVDVCATQSFFDYAQINLTVTPILSELPQTVALGINDYHQNVSGTMVFVQEVSTPVMYPSLEGETTLNSFIEGEKSKISELNIGSMGYDLSGGDMNNFEEVSYQFSGGFDIIGCWCPGMVEAYDNGPN